MAANDKLRKDGEVTPVLFGRGPHAATRRARKWRFHVQIGLTAAFLLLGAASLRAQTDDGRLTLKDGWAIQSSEEVSVPGEAISQPGYNAKGWYFASIPTTVLAALVANKVYPDPDFGMNLRSIPGTSYKIGANFSNEQMPKDSPFRVSWWYRTEFELPAVAWNGREVWLNFRGINYRANIWMNGRLVAGQADVAGAFRRYEFDVTSGARVGAKNAIAVEILAPHPDDLAITFVDWNPLPPDKDMGLWGDVFLTSSGPVAIRNPQVISKLDGPDLGVAHLTISTELRNSSNQSVTGVLRGTLSRAIAVSQPVTLAPRETKVISFSPDQFDDLNIQNPDLWWPYRMGSQNLQQLHLEFAIGNEISDAQNLQFGIDEITSELTDGHRLFKINGKRILIRGAGWTPDMMLRDSADRWEKDFQYVKGMNLNAVRLEGKLVGDDFFDLADRYGILVMAGWCCCDHWEKWRDWKSNEQQIATASLRDQAVRLRNHASVFVWLNGSDNPPPPEVEQAYLDVLKKANWPKPILSSASAERTSVTGATGVKMTGPYDYVPPIYWTEDTHAGGAFGYNSETSPGPAIPPLESLKQMFPADRLWPINEDWNFHAGGGPFKNLTNYTTALNKRYGPPKDLQDFVWKSQAIAYEGERAMFEAYGQNKYKSTGVIQWMLDNAWPSLIWHLYDYFLRPGGGYFGTQRACEPLHAQYSYADQMVYVVNDYQQPFSALTLSAKVYDIHAVEKYSHEATIDVAADKSDQGFSIPNVPGISTTYFLKLTLTNSAGQILSSNFYWLSTKRDTLVWNNSTWYDTPQASYSDFRQLSDMPKVNLKWQAGFAAQGGDGTAQVQLENPGKDVAFLVRARILRGKSGDEVLPVLWDDNYVSLLPGEKRTLTATYHQSDLAGVTPEIAVDGWNVPASQGEKAPE